MVMADRSIASIASDPGRRSRPSVLRIDGPLLGPTQSELARRVETLLDRGERWLVLDLRQLSELDAAGVGELVLAFNRTRVAGGKLQIANASRHVQTLLDVTCVSKLLTTFRDPYPAPQPHAPNVWA